MPREFDEYPITKEDWIQVCLKANPTKPPNVTHGGPCVYITSDGKRCLLAALSNGERLSNHEETVSRMYGISESMCRGMSSGYEGDPEPNGDRIGETQDFILGYEIGAEVRRRIWGE